MINAKHTFYHDMFIVNYGKSKGLVSDGSKGANLGRCEGLGVFKMRKHAGLPFHDLWGKYEFNTDIQSHSPHQKKNTLLVPLFGQQPVNLLNSLSL